MKQRLVVLSIDATGNERGRGARDELLHEDDSSAPGILRLAAHIAAEIDLLEIAIEGNRKTEHAGAPELKGHDADEHASRPGIQLATRRDAIRERARVDRVTEHDQVAPIRTEEATLGRQEIVPRPAATYSGRRRS